MVVVLGVPYTVGRRVSTLLMIRWWMERLKHLFSVSKLIVCYVKNY